MSELYLSKGMFPTELLQPTLEFILATQQPDGSIPWFEGGHTDPWNHIEAAMGLSIGGQWQAAEAAYAWLQNTQLDDGSWWSQYQQEHQEEHQQEHQQELLEDSQAEQATPTQKESNHTAYIACGVWHHFLITGDESFLNRMWPCVTRAMAFVLGQQQPEGDINWAVTAAGEPREDALITGCNSIYKSLECALNIAARLGEHKPDWHQARQRLGARAAPQARTF